ncbi:MAG: hypothetical protein ABI851_14840 [Saprospiraceae bacterium]
MARIIIGPEIIWLAIYLGATLLAKANSMPTKRLDNFIENCWFWIPLMALICFALWWLPAVDKNWLLLRVWIVSLIAGHYSLEKVMSAYSIQGPGIGTAYMLGILFLIVILVVGTVVIKIKF